MRRAPLPLWRRWLAWRISIEEHRHMDEQVRLEHEQRIQEKWARTFDPNYRVKQQVKANDRKILELQEELRALESML